LEIVDGLGLFIYTANVSPEIIHIGQLTEEELVLQDIIINGLTKGLGNRHIAPPLKHLKVDMILALKRLDCMIALIRVGENHMKEWRRKYIFLGKSLIEDLFIQSEFLTEVKGEVNIRTIAIFSNLKSFCIIASPGLVNRREVDMMCSTVVLKIRVPSVPAVRADISEDWKSG